MLLTCPQCQNSFMVDDQAYAMQGGALCEQCQVPLVPSNVGYGQQTWQGQWGQQPMDQAQWGQQPDQAQWGQQPMDQAQWGQQPMDQAQWGQQPMGQAQWGQQPMDQAQWGQQPMDQAQWGQQPPSDAQWGQQPMDQAQWGQQPMDQAQWGQQPPSDAQWGQQPMGQAQWGQQPPSDAQWGQAQWGQQPPSDAQWGQMADGPKETVMLADAVEQDDVVRHNDANERTIALSDWNEPASSLPSLKPTIPASNVDVGGDGDDWGAWESPKSGRIEEVRTTDAAAIGQAQPNPNALVVGNALPPGAHEGMTREIDVREVQSLYGDKLNPVAEFFRSIPMRYRIIASGVLGVSIIAFVIAAIALTRDPEVEKVIRNGEIVDANAPEKEKSFNEIAKESISLSTSFIPFDGKLAKEGSIVGVAEDIGVYYDTKKIAEIDDVMRGGAYVEKVASGIEGDDSKISQPITVLFGESMPMSAVYRTLYTLGPSMRRLYLGGTTQGGVSTFEYHPCGWPDHDMFIFESCKDVPIDVKITRTQVTIRRVSDVSEVPLVVLEDGTELSEVSTKIIGTKVQFEGIQAAIARLSIVRGAVRFVADGDVSFGVFMTVAQRIYGTNDKPNIKTLYVAPVPLI